MNIFRNRFSATARALFGTYCDLAKARLSALVVMTTLVGYLLASLGPVDWARLIWTLLGTGLIAGGVNALNQWMEADRDGRMVRTRNRPIPAGAVGSRHALIFGVVLSLAGPAILLFAVNEPSAWLALITGLIYVAIYTPLKTRNSLCTLVGAVVGAIPPVIGWVAAGASIGFGALILAALLFVWQIPHFLSLAWLYREDYARGGFRMLPVVDPDGRSTFRMTLLYSLALLPVAFGATLAGLAGWVYGVVSIGLALWMITLGTRFYRRRGDGDARKLFLASLIYLPVLLVAMILDEGPAGMHYTRPAIAAEPVAVEQAFADPASSRVAEEIATLQ